MLQIAHALVRAAAFSKRRFVGVPRGQQEVLALCDWAGQSYEEAAAALAIPIGTVRSRLARARAAVRELEAPART